MTVAMSRGLLVALVILWISPYSLSHSYYMRWNAKSQAFFVYPQQAGSPLGIRSTEGASCCFGGTMEWFRSLIYNFSICTPAQKIKRAATDFVSHLRLFQLITPTDPRGTGPPGFSGRWRPPRWAYPRGRSRRTTCRCCAAPGSLPCLPRSVR